MLSLSGALASPSSAAQNSLACTHTHTRLEPAQGDEGEGGITAVASWAVHRVGGYVNLLGAHLTAITEGGALASVLEHAMYCGLSLARVGLDIRQLLAPVFEAAVLGLFARSAQVNERMHARVASMRARRSSDDSSCRAPRFRFRVGC